MYEFTLTGNSLNNTEKWYQGIFGHTLGPIHHISIMSRIDIYYTKWFLGTQTVAPTIPGFQGVHHCIPYLASHPHKYIFYTYNYYDFSNVIRLTWSGFQVEYCTTQKFLECHQDADCARIVNRINSVLVITHTLLGVFVPKYEKSIFMPEDTCTRLCTIPIISWSTKGMTCVIVLCRSRGR